MVQQQYISSFQPENLSPQKRERLDALLDQIDAATTQRGEKTNRAVAQGFRAWLSKPSKHQANEDFIEIHNAIPMERWPAVFKENMEVLEKVAGTTDLIKQLKTLPYFEQVKAVSYAASDGCKKFLDKVEERKDWKQISKLYDQILLEFPDILISEKDAQAANDLAAAIVRQEKETRNGSWSGIVQKSSLQTIWKTASGQAKLEKAKEILKKAFPQDNVSNLHIEPVNIKKATAGYILSTAADTMICGPFMTKNQAPDFPLFMLTHEYQHRRQVNLVTQLEKNKLQKGSADYYQARLFKANFDGGYLSPMNATKAVTKYAQLADYMDQPVERQANQMGTLVSNAADMSGAMQWKVTEKLSRVFSSVAQPVAQILYTNDKIAATAKSLVSGNKALPAGKPGQG